MKKNSVFLKIRINAGEIFYKFFPKILLDVVVHFLRFVRGTFLKQTIYDKKIFNFGQKKKHVFFGYYDITPFSRDDTMLLAIRAPLINRAPEAKDEAEIGFCKINDSNYDFFSLGTTSTWCWQQGCRLQWYPGKEKMVIYNCLVNGEYGSVIKRISDGSIVREIGKSLYSISLDGRWGLSLDFSRLQRLRPGYGYGILPDKSIDNPKPSYGGIELVDLETNEFHQLFSVKEISEIEPHDSMDGAEHYFNHLMFSPSGNKFLFFHLWVKLERRYSRMFVADKNGSNIRLLNNSGSVSHYNWVSDDEIILYSFVKEKNKYMYATFSSLDSKVSFFGKNAPKKDGHPTLFKNGEIFVTDTYPDLLFQRSIISYNIKKDEVLTLARFDSPLNFTGEFRCDLHPRISNNKKTLCVDRIIDDRRSISIISLDVL